MMNQKLLKTIDANEAVASVAYRLNEVIAIYPITPSSNMGEWVDAWSAEKKPNLWGTIPSVVEMQSEAGVAGALHGSLQTGSLSTTFTASQGLLLMIPNMYKIAGELIPTVFHVAARTLATHALSIFGDHSDVMAARATGFAMLSSSSVQEAMDFALIAHAATLESRIPFLHFFDGFRTSHEISKIEFLEDEILKAMISEKRVEEHRQRALSTEHPSLRGTSQNPDVFFQTREAANPYYSACPDIVQNTMDRFSKLTGRSYDLFEYWGAPDAQRIIVTMGSSAQAVYETVHELLKQGQKVGLIKVHLYRPFNIKQFLSKIPLTTQAIAVLDRTKEPGAGGEPLYMDVVNAVFEGIQNEWCHLGTIPKIIGGRYGLSSKEFTPGMVKGIFDHLSLSNPLPHFTIGICDDVSKLSLPYDTDFHIEDDAVYQALFYGLGSDGTVGANKSSIKIIGKETSFYTQGYFVYDSRKSGSITISHLRFGPQPIRSSYLISKADFVGCHQAFFLDRYDILGSMRSGGTFLLNTHHGAHEVWKHLSKSIQNQIRYKNLAFYCIDAYKIARENGMGAHINTIMQVCFFKISGILPLQTAITNIKDSIQKTYKNKGETVVAMNLKVVDLALEHLSEVKIPQNQDEGFDEPPRLPEHAPLFVKNVLSKIISNEGDKLPVSALPCDGTFPTGTSKWEKRNLAQEIPVWDSFSCIQCGKCSMVCPHSVIRIKVYDPDHLKDAPQKFKHCDARDPEWKNLKYTIQVAPEDCTGCAICVDVCPAKNKIQPDLKALYMAPELPLKMEERENWKFFLEIPDFDRTKIKVNNVRQQQLQQPLFEFSSACLGCGETPYLKLLSQLFSDRLMIANATGCSSIYGGNLPTTPWTQNKEGRGPAWCNSLFEDNAEFGFGFRLSLDKQNEFAKELLTKLSDSFEEGFAQSILYAPQKTEADMIEQKSRIQYLKTKLQALSTPEAKLLLSLADALIKKSVWIVGGDGWAYDIGFGGLDHVLASGKNINILVLDTEVYSNTGGQMSKSTPRGAVAKFASNGKTTAKKDLGLIAMSYGSVYVATVAMGARDDQTLRAMLEAEAYEGPSLIIAYSHCIAHGINMSQGMRSQKMAVDTGSWILYRYNPLRAQNGENPLTLDSHPPKISIRNYFEMENRFRQLIKNDPLKAQMMIESAEHDIKERRQYYENLAAQLSPSTAVKHG